MIEINLYQWVAAYYIVTYGRSIVLFGFGFFLGYMA
jgi:hypothetical protein